MLLEYSWFSLTVFYTPNEIYLSSMFFEVIMNETRFLETNWNCHALIVILKCIIDFTFQKMTFLSEYFVIQHSYTDNNLCIVNKIFPMALLYLKKVWTT